MKRLSLLSMAAGLIALAAGLLVDSNLGRIAENGTIVQTAEAARRVTRTTVRRGPRVTTVKRTMVKRGKVVKHTAVVTPRGVARRTTRRVIRRSTIFVAALPRGCFRTTMYGYVVWSCGGRYYQPYSGRYVVVTF